MKTIKALVLVAAVMPGLGPITMPAPVAAVSEPSGIDSRLRLDWEAGTRRGGKPAIQGYIYNDNGRPRTSTCWWRRSTPPAR